MKMTNQVALTVSIFSLLLTHTLNAECNYPKKSFVIPQGSKSTESEMVEVNPPRKRSSKKRTF